MTNKLKAENTEKTNSPKIETLERNSSYIFRFLIVEPMRILR